MTSSPRRLDPGAKGGLAGLVLVVALLVALVAAYTARPLLCGAMMAAVGAAGVMLDWRVAIRRRRYFSAIEWLTQGALLLAAYGIMHWAPSVELSRYWAADGNRERNTLLIVAVLAGIGLVSLWMLRGGRSGNRHE